MARTRRRRTKGTGGVSPYRDGQWRISWMDGAGQRRSRILPKGARRRDAEALLAQKLAQARAEEGSRPAPPGRQRGVAFDECADRWLASLRSADGQVLGSLDPGTIQGYERIVETQLKPAFTDSLLSAITSERLSAYKAARLDGDKRARTAGGADSGRKLSPNTVRNHLTVMSAILGFADESKDIDYSGVPRIELPRRKPTEPRILTRQQARQLVEALPEHDRALALTLIQTGMRIGEAVVLEWGDIEQKRAIISVRRTLKRDSQGRRKAVGFPKSTKSKRQIKISPQLLKVLQGHRAKQPAGCPLVFPNRKGQRTDPDTWRETALYGALKKLGIPRVEGGERITAHTLRHTHASLALQPENRKRPVSVKELSARLGHSTVAFTMDTYAHLLPLDEGSQPSDVI